jgi:SAM-dependent methyltransferase
MPTYAIRAPLARWLADQALAAHERFGPYRVLDVGCGQKPYYPFFAPYASKYVGVDPFDNPLADLTGPVESLPVADGGYEVVLCNQVLEHCDDPVQAVRELNRVTASGGWVLASTHGVSVYHPSPSDYWRWTHEGLEHLFRRNADWAFVNVSSASGTTACIAMLLCVYLDIGLRRVRARPLGRPLITSLNTLAEALDRLSPLLRVSGPGSLSANYHVLAQKT